MARKEDVPDSARSWAIALSGCVINAFMAGILRATGHIYLALIDTYGVSRFQANLPFTVRNVVRNLGGPLAGAVGQRFGPRNVTLLGGLLGSLGILLCSFAPNVLWITLLWGGMHGLGVALGNTLSQVVVTQYFVKHRATASGLANSGSCFGSFVLPALMEYMLFHFGLSGSFLITGGLLMHVIPAALILKEPSWLQRKENIITGNPSSKRKTNTGEFRACRESQNVLILDFKKRCSSDDWEPNKDGPKKCDTNLSAGQNGINNLTFTGSTTDIADIMDKVENLKYSDMKSGNLPSEEVEAPINEQQKQETSFLKAIIRTFSNPMFFLISLSLAALAFLIDPVFTVNVDFLKDKGLKEEVAKYFISSMAFGNLVGKLGFGWVTDRQYMSTPHFMMMMQIAQGICFMLLCLLYDFYMLMVTIAVVGMTVGATMVMFPVLIGKYLPSVQSMAIGCIPIFTGLVNVAVPPLIGYFRDEIGSYNGMFYITGSSSVIIGFLWFFEPLLFKCGQKLERLQNVKNIRSSKDIPIC
ncbi:hypothetical protein TNIN_211091 [Trichonephila inaurata madagascariensis]|uniref:Major facilitator superfamily (MFS) profile domain-containing protein n=1 Tax=Trichonephila inaurata madagascariensis TaxID=2747483 RepID=A0A8X7C901_9ARAC|nr:hypothetical protein TNIN_211091 [Trichonephila inaurata madagascariensis]